MLTIIIPVYNEINTLEKILDKIDEVDFMSKEIIIVDDASTDGTKSLIEKKLLKRASKVIFHKKNLGKGSAIKSAQNFINGDYVIIQDADLEYNPQDYLNLLKPIIEGKYKVVYGSRVLNKNRYKLKNFTSIFRIFANHILTIISNLLNKQKLTDAHTCYKLFKSDVFRRLNLQENGFSFCPEVTTKISNMNIEIFEVPISYNGRDYKSGKKIRFLDAIKALLTLIRYKFIKK